MDINIHPSWKNQLQSEFEKPYFKNLTEFVKAEYNTHTCYPKGDAIFNAFNWCTFDAVKVVIIGQDPYHGPGQANGLCFSVNDGIAHPPSLRNIFKELESDLDKPYPLSGNLEPWAKQGVLLLNATLTVRAGAAGSHQKKGWEIFTDAVIKTVSDQKQDVVFLLWGGFAKQKSKLIDPSKHSIISSGHPSPLSANRGYWFGNKSFSKTNSQLERVDARPIAW
ncbi:uracil-DNA glycosylase [Gelidibacter salicanalis]|uniref:Uracil-DNA glycosylase n=1 Tax=Gelidibacter salicanalis TaxID=291193 RepID=A0A934KX30_9FLAO|nr:uracil-DNA glycosylase [Gelidibacter salicanalis]MBJ7882453.1 uracil-DNA glycosylase [Gelidibacter salicanalis]